MQTELTHGERTVCLTSVCVIASMALTLALPMQQCVVIVGKVANSAETLLSDTWGPFHPPPASVIRDHLCAQSGKFPQASLNPIVTNL